jgi:hypothetical protein
MKLFIVLLFILLILFATGCDSFKKGFDEGHNKDNSEEVE